MKGNYLLMNEKERRRLEVLSRLKSKDITLVEAATIMNVSYRQALRIKENYFKNGDRNKFNRMFQILFMATIPCQ